MPPRTRAPLPTDPRQLHEEEDEELDLPPFDGATDDEAPRGEADDDDTEIVEAPALGEDDGGAFDLDPASELDALDDAPGEESEAARDAVDVGSLADAIALPDEDDRTSDERGLAHDEDEAPPFDAPGSDDTGSGTGEDLAGLVDEDALPPLGEDDTIDEATPPPAVAPAARAAPWERGRYHLATGLGAEVPCGLLAVSASYVVAAGPAVLVVVDGARVARGAGPDIDAVALAVTEATIVAATRRGALFSSLDGGESWIAGAGPLPAALPALPPIALAATPGRLWIVQRGALWSQRYIERDRPEPQVLVRKEGVRAMAAAGSSLVILTERPAAPERPAAFERSVASERPGVPEHPGGLAPPAAPAIERLRGDDEASAAAPLPAAVSAAVAAAGPGEPVLAAAAGGKAIVIAAGESAHVSRDGGASFERYAVGPVLAAAFAGTGAGAAAMVLVRGERRADMAAELVEIDRSGRCARVAEIIGGAEGPAALAWDAAREVLWVACEVGLLAFERSTRH